MASEREQLLQMCMPESVAERGEIFSPSSVGVIIHTGDFVFEERRRKRSGEPGVLLVRQADEQIDGFKPWGVPAGRTQEGEGIIQTAVREVKEETAIEVEPQRLRWFCPTWGDKHVVLSYQIGLTEIPRWREAVSYELGIKIFPPSDVVNTAEIDRLALVPVEVFADHMLVGSHRHFVIWDEPSKFPGYPQKEVDYDKLIAYHYARSRPADEEIDFVPAMYKGKIWQDIRHQMFVRKIIPAYLG